MERDEFFTTEEKKLLFSLYRKLLQLTGETLQKGDCRKLKTHLINSIKDNRVQRDTFGLNPLVKDMQTAVIVAEEIGMKRASILGIMLHESVRNGACTPEEVQAAFGEDVAGIIRGLIRDGYPVTKGFKIADIDPRKSELSNCFTISDKARCIAGSVLELITAACWN